MDSLFSHAPEPSSEPAPAQVAPEAARTLHLPLAPEQAAEAVVDYLHLWWPAASVLAAKEAKGAHLWWDAEGLGAELEDGRQLLLAETSEWAWPEGAAARFVEGPLEGTSLAMSLSAREEGTALSIAGELALVRQLSDSFSRFMGISG